MNLADSLHFADLLPGSVTQELDRLERQRIAIKTGHERQQSEFEHEQVKMLPPSWQRKVLNQHRKVLSAKGMPDANRWLLEFAERVSRCRIVPNTTDIEIREIADTQAARAQRYADRCQAQETTRDELSKLCSSWQIDPPDIDTPNEGAIARMVDPLWWRRKLRRVHAGQLEDLAREIGEVGKGRGLFLSDESFQRFKRQYQRNRAILERTEAVSEDGEILTLANIADSTVSNPAHRRGETMTRINGIEEIAREVGCVADFVTLTCPSRMHVRLDSGADNPKFDGTTARQARSYLQDLWQSIRAKLQRQGIMAIGMRVCEPHHDGTPHWHFIIFVWPHQVAKLRNIITEYALRDSPDEPGARQHRAKFEVIDYTRGSGAGYVAKYVSKNIDAFGLTPDLLDDMQAPDEKAARAVAWSRTHSIRQFQFFGAAPIGLWRELRRIPKENMTDAPQALLDAWHAAQKEGSKRASFGAFIKAIGGLGKKAKELLIGLAKEWNNRLGRYGDQIGWKPAGIVASDEPERVFYAIHKVWTVLAKRCGSDLTPWTRFNNCTRSNDKNIAGGQLLAQSGAPPPETWPTPGGLMPVGS